MSITLHPTITINEAQKIAAMHDCQIVPDQRHPGDYILTPRIIRDTQRNNVTNIRQPAPEQPVDFPRVGK